MCIFQSPQKDWIIFKVSELMLRWFSRFQLFVTLWGIAHQASLSMGFSRQEYWSALPCPPPEDLPGPGIEPTSLLPPALAGGFFTTSTTGKAPLRSVCVCVCVCVSVCLCVIVTQSCLTLCDPMDYNSSASPVRWFSRKEYGSGWPFPSPGDLPNPVIKMGSPTLQADCLTSKPPLALIPIEFHCKEHCHTYKEDSH